MSTKPLMTAEEPNALALTAQDVQTLLKENSPEIREIVADKIAVAYSGSQLAGQELRIAEHIFRLLAIDAEVRVRASLSQHLKSSPSIPRDIMMTLARDVEEVSLPVLQYSQVLTDADLLDLMEASDALPRLLAISRRETVSDAVADSLAATGKEEVIESLVGNPGAIMGDTTLGRIIDAHSGNEAMMKSLSARAALPAAVMEKLLHAVSSSLAESLKKNHNIPDEQLQKEIETTRESETLSLLRNAHTTEECEKLAAQLYTYGRLTPSIILSALCQGNTEFFEISLARCCHIPTHNARTLIHDRGGLGFQALYAKSGLPDAMFPAVKLLLDVVRELDAAGEQPGTSSYANRAAERLLHHAETQTIDNLSYILALVRRSGH